MSTAGKSPIASSMTPACVTDELASILRTLVGAGAKVLDFAGREGGHHHAELAEQGFNVGNVENTLDPGAIDVELPCNQYDAAICAYPPPWNDDAGAMRLLLAVRAKLSDDGVLILADGQRRTMSDLTALVRASGFATTPAPAPSWICARAVPVLPEALALQVHHSEQAAGLNLRWSPDEADFLVPRPDQIWAPLLATDDLSRIACDYALSDPWGGMRAAPAISSFFGVQLAADNIAFGAGATGLLRQLASLPRCGRLVASRLAHRDLLLWAMAEGAEISWIADEDDETQVLAAIKEAAPQLVYLERPSVNGNILGLDGLTRICREAREHRALVLVDEAYLSYFAGSGSAVALAPAVDNLIVVRSLSKAYCAGGLRAGFAVAGTAAARYLRRLVAPLQVSELAFQMALRLLQAGDIFVQLRERIALAKSEMNAILGRAGIPVLSGHPQLPWILIDDASGRMAAMMQGRGISGKKLAPLVPAAGAGLLRLAVPLSDQRRMQFRRALDGAS
jgi:histidinol-phosphate/aromatic aminotransferase/cobyric acid decarboxylase-like protein